MLFALFLNNVQKLKKGYEYINMRKLISVLLTVMILAVTFSVAVSAEIGDAINLAEDKPTEASSVWSGAGYEPDKAVDENPTTFWSNLYELEDDDGTWLIVDLEAKTVINTVTITERSALISRFGKWSIDVSDDGTTWKTVLSGIDDDIEVGADTTDATAVTNEFSFTAVETRYVRLSIPEMGDPSKTNMGLWEFGIYNIGNATVPAASEPAPAPVTGLVQSEYQSPPSLLTHGH